MCRKTRDGAEPFQTRILEAYRRRSETLEALIPQLYVKGLSVRDTSDTLAAVFALDVSRRWRGIRLAPADLENLMTLRQALAPLKATA